LWVQKRCSKPKGKLAHNTNFSCQRCLGQARPIDARTQSHIPVEDSSLEVLGLLLLSW
jgi:hypothetical protein